MMRIITAASVLNMRKNCAIFWRGSTLPSRPWTWITWTTTERKNEHADEESSTPRGARAAPMYRTSGPDHYAGGCGSWRHADVAFGASKWKARDFAGNGRPAVQSVRRERGELAHRAGT